MCKYIYYINMPPNDFLNSLKTHTTNILTEKSYSEGYNFYGVISNHQTRISAVPSSGRRAIFNPVLDIQITDKDNASQIKISALLDGISIFMCSIFIIMCSLFGLIIYNISLENNILFPLTFILPLVLITIIISCFFIVFKINLKDARERFEDIYNCKLD